MNVSSDVRRTKQSFSQLRCLMQFRYLLASLLAGLFFASVFLMAQPERKEDKAKSTDPKFDPAAEAVKTKDTPKERPEQQLTEHDKSGIFDPTKPAPINGALKNQPKQGRITGFEFSRDPLNADKPFTTFAEVMNKESEAKPKVMPTTANSWKRVTT